MPEILDEIDRLKYRIEGQENLIGQQNIRINNLINDLALKDIELQGAFSVMFEKAEAERELTQKINLIIEALNDTTLGEFQKLLVIRWITTPISLCYGDIKWAEDQIARIESKK